MDTSHSINGQISLGVKKSGRRVVRPERRTTRGDGELSLCAAYAQRRLESCCGRPDGRCAKTMSPGLCASGWCWAIRSIGVSHVSAAGVEGVQ
jgi:hypothetical protein